MIRNCRGRGDHALSLSLETSDHHEEDIPLHRTPLLPFSAPARANTSSSTTADHGTDYDNCGNSGGNPGTCTSTGK